MLRGTLEGPFFFRATVSPLTSDFRPLISELCCLKNSRRNSVVHDHEAVSGWNKVGRSAFGCKVVRIINCGSFLYGVSGASQKPIPDGSQ
jgi:hypothetical protein